MKKFNELHIDFDSYEQLSFVDDNDTHIILSLNEKPLGKVKVFTDVENEKREYICINHEVVYLDTLNSIAR